MQPSERQRRVVSISVPRRAVAIAATLIILGSSSARTIHAPEQSSNVPEANPQNGKLIFDSQGCNKCHGSEGEGVSAPEQSGGVPRIASTSLPLTTFVQLVRKPRGQMPPFGNQKLSDKDLADIYAFLQSVSPSTGRDASTSVNPEKGKLLFERYGCYECHGYQGQGSTQTGGSRLGPPQIPLSAFVNYVRSPSGQMPPYATKVASEQDLADIYSFLQSLPQPPPPETIPLLNQ